MNAGKTTTVGSLVKGLRAAGVVPGAAKVTGTGSGADFWVMVDAGADSVVDFTDAGLASTYLLPPAEVESTFVQLVDHLTEVGSSHIVVEIADGLFQRETAHLLASDVFSSTVDGVVFAAADSLGAVFGGSILRSLGLPLRAVSGALTASDLAMREAARHLDVPVLTKDELAEPARALDLVSVVHDLRFAGAKDSRDSAIGDPDTGTGTESGNGNGTGVDVGDVHEHSDQPVLLPPRAKTTEAV